MSSAASADPVRDLIYLSHRIPYPPNKGDKIRAWNFLYHLTRNFNVHLGCFIDDPDDWKYKSALDDVCASVHCVALDKRRQRLRSLVRARPGRALTLDYFGSEAMQRWVDQVCAAHRMAFGYAFSSGVAGYLAGRTGLCRVLDMVDIDSEKFAEYGKRAGWPARIVWTREGRNLLAFERAVALDYDLTLFVTEAEVNRFAQLAPETRPRIDFIENGVDLDSFTPRPPEAGLMKPGVRHLVFTGTMDYWPNVDAMTWFANTVLPLLRTEARRGKGEDVHLTIVGATPDPAVTALAGGDITVTGRVADVRPYLAGADVVIAPLRIARGVQNKVLEAMAMGRPVVASPEAFEGIRVQAGRDLIVAGEPLAMAEAIGDVAAGRRAGLGPAGRAAVERFYGWPSMFDRLDRLMALAEKGVMA